MSQLYSRVFVKILQSSLAEDWHVRHVFEDFLKLASAEGIVDITRPAFCRVTNTPKDVFDRAIDALEAPDAQSRETHHDGRRLVRLDDHRDWGWMIVNWDKYEGIRTKEDEREVERRRKRDQRSKPSPSGSPIRSPAPTSASASASGAPGQVPEVSSTSPGHVPDICRAEARPCSTELPLAMSPSPTQAPAATLPLSSPSPTVKTPPAPRTDRYEAAKEILAFLNSEAKREFAAVPANLNLIRDRIREAMDDVEGVKTMLLRKVREWKGTDMEGYLRPATLFGKLKFRGYYDDRNQPLPPQDGHTNGRAPAQKMHPDGRPRSIAMQLLREVEAEAGLVPGQY